MFLIWSKYFFGKAQIILETHFTVHMWNLPTQLDSFLIFTAEEFVHFCLCYDFPVWRELQWQHVFCLLIHKRYVVSWVVCSPRGQVKWEIDLLRKATIHFVVYVSRFADNFVENMFGKRQTFKGVKVIFCEERKGKDYSPAQKTNCLLDREAVEGRFQKSATPHPKG